MEESVDSKNESCPVDQEMAGEEDMVSDEEVVGKLTGGGGTDGPGGRRDFSSENFKIEIQNLPKFFGIAQAKKLINKKLKLNAHKLKPCGPKASYMFVCFKNVEEKEKAITVLDGFTLKGQKLKVFSAKAVKDPFHSKKMGEEMPAVLDTRPPEERLQEVLCPYATLSYDEQLAKKQAEVLTIVKRLGSEVTRCNPDLKELVEKRLAENSGTVAELADVVRSPVLRGYRNKCEFSIGYANTDTNVENPETEPKNTEPGAENTEQKNQAAASVAVGFRLATYKQGSVEVVSLSSLKLPEDVLPHISPQMIKTVVLFEQLVRVSGINPYSSVTNTGNWRHLMLRSAGDEDEKQLMAVAVLDPMDLTREQVASLKSDLVTFFTSGAGSPCNVTSLFIHLSPAKKSQGNQEPVPELLHGDPVITEQLFNLKFHVSPQAFFQVNTKAAEVLYRTVGEMADLQTKSTLVDVCCGTGTIGLCLADKVKQVIGVELVPEAVRDARKNATNNSITNSTFFAGRAEQILGEILRDIDSKDIVAVVDPPRAGLHHKALSAIRNTKAIRRLVYVSCDAKNAMKNFVDLSRAESKTTHGDPFLPVKIIPVDLFPFGKQYELVFLFERVSNSGDDKTPTVEQKQVEEEATVKVE